MSGWQIAIVGRACVLPGALSPAQLWDAVREGRDLIGSAPPGRWRMPIDRALGSADAPQPDRAWNDRGGYVEGFETIWDPNGFALPAEDIETLDPLVHWLLHCSREAMREAHSDSARVGAVFGNLGFPSEAMASYADSVWRGDTVGADPRNRFMSGGTAAVLQQALQLEGGALSLDAACASSLYAIKLACDRLREGSADLMLAGAVQRADDLFLHMGFSALQALSRSGRSRPFHRDADGLLPAEGCAMLALKRLDDAQRDGDTVYGVIRAIGLSNDGRGKGLLVPDSTGQQRAMRLAWEAAELDPACASLLECHATGTPVGDATELQASAAIFADARELPIGSLKSNLGHLITVAGAAGLIKLTEAMRHGIRPPTLHVEQPTAALQDTPFRVLNAAEDWSCEGQRVAGLSAFGFGGNNAHLVLEEVDSSHARVESPSPQPTPRPSLLRGRSEPREPMARLRGPSPRTRARGFNPRPLSVSGSWAGQSAHTEERSRPAQQEGAKRLAAAMAAERERVSNHLADGPIAIIALGILAGPCRSRTEFTDALFAGKNLRNADGESPIDAITLDLHGLRVPPNDLAQALPQQLAMLQAAREAMAEVSVLPHERTAVFIGMEPDAEVARFGTRWRMHGDAAQRDAVVPALQAAGVLGCMPNIPANRLSSAFDLGGPAFTLQAGEQSALAALDIACRGLRLGEFDAALIGAVDFGCEPVNRAASGRPSADAAVAFVLKRLADAERDGDRVYALVEAATASAFEPLPDLGERIGRSGAAEGGLRLAAAALCLHHGRTLDGRPWLPHLVADADERVSVGQGPPYDMRGFCAQADGLPALQLRVAAGQPRRSETPSPRLYAFAGQDRAAVLAALLDGDEGLQGTARLVIVCSDAEFDAHRARAIAHLREGAPAGHAIHFRKSPISGDVAFAFAGAGAAYRGMGRALLEHLPQLGDRLAQQSQRLATALSWAFDPAEPQPSVLQQLWGASALSQLHLALSEEVLGLKADAWLGYSSGETNALVAAGVWREPDTLITRMEASGLATRELGGEFAAVASQWGEAVRWASWTVLASPDAVREAIADLPRVYLAIINGESDCLIAGDAAGCGTAVQRLGAARCLALDYPFAVHVPELSALRDQWLELHTLPSHAPRHGRIYSTAWGHSYTPDTESCARAILDQAEQSLDIRPLVLQAWADGVRIFIEHGPRSGFGRAIRDILGYRECLVVSLDRQGQGIEAVLHAVAALLAAGVSLNHEHLTDLLAPARQLPAAKRPMRFAGHWPAVQMADCDSAQREVSDTPIPEAVMQDQIQIMSPAPVLPSVFSSVPGVCATTAQPAVVMAKPPLLQDIAPARGAHPALAAWQDQLAHISSVHGDFLRRQRVAQAGFLAQRRVAQAMLLGSPAGAVNAKAIASQAVIRVLRDGAQSAPLSLREGGAGGEGDGIREHLLTMPSPPSVFTAKSEFFASSVPSPQPLSPEGRGAQLSQASGLARETHTAPVTPLSSGNGEGSNTNPLSASPNPPTGPYFTFEQLLIHADGRISDIFGPAFKSQDRYTLQVRMPRPPLLLADRVLGIEGEAGRLGAGRIWTETDVSPNAWYLQHGRMPAGVMIEAGQADLMLVSWQGIDAHNRGERVYRLLGCELTYHGDLPRVGDTLRFDIHLDDHAAQGDVRLMFFHYDGMNGERPQLSVRKGQAGFFTAQELAESAGCLWSPESQQIVPDPRLDPADITCAPRTLDRAQLEAFADGNSAACFGQGFELARTHTRSPAIHSGRMLLLDRVTELEQNGGPWQRGYLRAELDIHPQQWFFDGHFKNDPCMPGTLMFEACLQAMAIYLAGCGYTLKRDGWRFQPVPELPYQLQCRGQVTPSSKCLVTEIFVEERISGPEPTVYADLLCTVDGLKAFHARRVALQLVPDWPLESDPVAGSDYSGRDVAVVDGFAFDQRAVLACALGKPSSAFGPMYRRFDGTMRVARLPSPPYLFISRIAEVHGPIGVMRAGARVVAEYDLPESVWYLDENGCRTMPFAVMLEAALQPCGWLSSYVGSALTVESELGFRNLDGEGTVLAELRGGDGILRTEVELTDVSASAGMIIENFSVRCWLGEREVYRLRTVFGFFPPEALANQAGLPRAAAQAELLARKSDRCIDLDDAQREFFASDRPRLPGRKLRMIDRIEGWWPDAGAAGLGQLRAVKDVDPGEWFFQAHFFQDPVQPGSLGLEAMLQALQAAALLKGLDEGIEAARFESIALDRNHQWKYRGQVLPHNRQVHTTLELTTIERDVRGVLLLGDASLWVDGMRIYEAKGLGLRIVAGSA